MRSTSFKPLVLVHRRIQKIQLTAHYFYKMT